MNGLTYYGPSYNIEANGDSMGIDGMSSGSIGGGQSLDDIVNQNAKAMRRRSVPVQYGASPPTIDGDLRRMSMMEFGGDSGAGVLDGFQFDMSAAASMGGMMRAPMSYPQPAGGERRPNARELALNTQFPNQPSPYGPMLPPGSQFASPMATSTPLEMELNSPYVPASLAMPLDLTDPSLSTMMSSDVPSIGMFPQSQNQYPTSLIGSPMQPGFSESLTRSPQDPGEGVIDAAPQVPGSDKAPSLPPSVKSEPRTTRTNSQEQSSNPSRPPSTAMTPLNVQTTAPAVPMGQESASTAQGLEVANRQQFPWTTPPGGFPSTMHGRPHMQTTQYKNAYSSTGFDMLRVLMHVATRPNPEINIGSVDMSCAFVVCDAELDDNPIVYCTENFERLTGYSRHEILGRNCRFLQSPNGKVEAGVKRKYVDDDSVYYLKQMINMRREAQISLINYRRGGQPFMNLLTMIPIRWDTDQIKYFVGFQVDLVEQPNSVTNRNPGGSFSVNYQRSLSIPRYVLNTPESHPPFEILQTISRDEVSSILSTIGAGESELSKRIRDKILLENTDDVIHVMSLKGLFLYLSPACRRVLEYEPSELIGSALSSVCHPSDIVPVTRELKDTSAGSPVNVVFRIRRKHSGYMWFESHGSLHTEQGKGRKSIILVGRERPVYTVSKDDIESFGGIGETELWTKLSTSGMFLFTSSNVRSLLDRQPEELMGTSIQALMRPDSKAEFGRILEIARTGKKASVKHEMINKRGQVLSAFTTIYPGDAVEGQKPTFLVAQTRLLKFNRGGSHSSQRPALFPKQDREAGSVPSTVSTGATGSTGTASSLIGSSTPISTLSSGQYLSTEGAAATFAGQNGLPIGRQDASLASEENLFDELKTTRSTSWQYELRQMEKQNRLLAEEVQSLLAARKKRKRRKGAGALQKDCANCHTRVTPEWRRGPSGNRDLCNSCGLRWAKQNGRVSPRTSSQHSVTSAQSDKGSKTSMSPTTTAPILPIKAAEGQSCTPSALSQKTSPQQANSDSHAAKIARMEVAASQGLAGGVPPKIDEDPSEPD